MKDADKTKGQLINELVKIRQRIAELEKSETKRKQREKLTLQPEHDWENIFNTITDMITIHDKDFNIIRANKAAEKILELPSLGTNKAIKCFEHYHGKNRPPEGCPGYECLKTGTPANFELFEPHLNMFIEIRTTPRFDSNDELIELIHVVRDITERKNTQQKLIKSEKELKKKVEEFEKLYDIAVSRELKMKELKEEIAKRETENKKDDSD